MDKNDNISHCLALLDLLHERYSTVVKFHTIDIETANKHSTIIGLDGKCMHDSVDCDGVIII